MNYHIVSISNAGHGAIFTNKADAKGYQAGHPGSTYQVLDHLPDRIPPKTIQKDKQEIAPVSRPADPASENTDLSGPLTVHTDGSCLGNPGPGGYGVMIVDSSGSARELSQGYKHTTNSRMELRGIIAALESLDNDLSITLFSDSEYAINSINKGWAEKWRANGWKNSSRKPAKNIDLWARLLDLREGFNDLTFKWVKGHAGNPLNEKADGLAVAAARSDEQITDQGYKGAA